LKNHPSNRGFTLVEVLVVITIIVVLAAIAVPVSRSLVTRSHAVNCATNLRQIGLATMMYASDNNMTLPVTTHQRRQGGLSWTLSLQPYASGTITFKCADDEAKQRPYTYLINDFLTPNPAGAPELDFSRIAKIDRPEATFLFAEASATYQNSDHFHFSDYHGHPVPPAVFEDQVAVERHGGKSNFLFTDGHVETLSWLETQARLKAPASRFVDPSTP
jgi:prepilin-type N-terminal cleavage/methylation domain-containing protein/prepilin-type processing-associated H-X9-DG protein